MIYTNMSVAGATALSEELMLLGPRFADNIIVTQAGPSRVGLFERGARVQDRAGEILSGRDIRTTSRLKVSSRPNILIDALKRLRSADRNRKTRGRAREHAQSGSRSRCTDQFRPQRAPSFAQWSGERKWIKMESSSRSSSNDSVCQRRQKRDGLSRRREEPRDEGPHAGRRLI